jgi:hypothetical protein
MNSHLSGPVAILISIDAPSTWVKPWIIGPFPDGTDYSALLVLGDDIVDALSRRYPADTEIDFDVEIVSITSTDVVLDVERLADLITNEHAALDPEFADILDDVYVRGILDSITTDEVER